ncbi:MAG: Mpv17/PMP22 family protein [Planctomycetota bacterium]
MPESNLAFALRQGLFAARRNLLPALAIQAMALLVLLLWHWHPGTRQLLSDLATIKDAHSYPFAFVSTGIFGGVIPILVRWFWLREGAAKGFLPGLTLFWALKGLEVNGLYDLQALLVGADQQVVTVVTKVFFDQFVYVPFWAVPTMVIGYGLVEGEFRPWRHMLRASWYRQRYFPTMIANWAVWVPTVAIIYCLPTPLQLPLQNLILCMWSLLAAVLTRGEQATAS